VPVEVRKENVEQKLGVMGVQGAQREYPAWVRLLGSEWRNPDKLFYSSPSLSAGQNMKRTGGE